MSDCCCPTPETLVPADSRQICPHGDSVGKLVQLITLKSLLTPEALERLDTQASYRFCHSPDCSVIYSSNSGQVFTTIDLTVPVFQKDIGDDVPVCYCFGWTRQRIESQIEQTGKSNAVESIMVHIKAGRCGCEVNNPQGACCLGNIRQVVVQHGMKMVE